MVDLTLNRERRFLKLLENRDAGAWRELYECYYSALCHYAFRVLEDGDLSADIVQGVIIRLWENLPVFETSLALRLYLYRAVRNNCLQYIRNRNREDKRLKEWALFTEEETSGAWEGMVTEEVIRKLRRLIDALPPKRQQVILMSMKKMSNEEISEVMRITIHAVKKHKKEAYAYIRRMLSSDLYILLHFFLNKGNVISC